MDEPVYNTQGDFANNVVRLVGQSDKFLESMRTIKTLQSGTSGLLDNVKKLVYSADISNVSSIGIDLDSLDSELQTLLQKFYVIQNSYKRDKTLSSFLGDYSKNQQDAYTKLVSYSDGCIQQIDSVITAYSRVEKGVTKANLWVKHILSHYASKSVSEKARKANAIIVELSKIVSHIRDQSHNAKLELLNIRNLSSKHVKPSTQAMGQ
jgi:hypothetical protein|tara:strand:+ start:501 stop:1124 length:624 start_codon:yes stop_codon:yes gene_type:complete